ncbi:MAG: hypothetical protein O3B01_32525 [Planctomycetota bacterium]|nr:hypothetical protein [Planctomycetota bacterium]MDA1143306.1 hypothetical protein [Planctomycetota bacterium]
MIPAVYENSDMATVLEPRAKDGLKYCESDLTVRPEGDIYPVRGPIQLCVTPMWAFHSDEGSVEANRPVVIRHWESGEAVLAENDNLGIYESGATLQEAIEEFSDTLVHFFVHYSSKAASEVMGEAARRKKLYAELFQET